MRWYWIDRFEKFVAGVEAVTIKNVTLAEEPLDDYLPGYPHYPHSLIIEGLAQTGGLLVSQLSDFKDKVVLAKVGKATFHQIAGPGDQLRLTTTLVSQQSDGAIVEAKAEVNGQLQAEAQLTFAILDDSFGDSAFFIPSHLSRVLRGLRLYEVGVYPDGRRLEVPPYMQQAEIEALSGGED